MNAASDYWSSRAASGYAPNWYSLCAVEIGRRVTGKPLPGLTGWALTREGKVPARNLLEIGCLSGDKLVRMKVGGLATRVYGVDYAAMAIEDGLMRQGEYVDLRVMDLNDPTPMGGRFDVILANGVLHHIAKLELCADWLVEHLENDGVLFASEFTGPQRYRYTKHEIALINEGVAMLPESLREEFTLASLQPKLDADPSESVRSRDIADVLEAAGLSIEAIPYGGNVLMRALSRTFFANFRPTDPEHVASLDRLVAFDEEVMRSEPSHHYFIIGRHRRSGRALVAAAA